MTIARADQPAARLAAWRACTSNVRRSLAALSSTPLTYLWPSVPPTPSGAMTMVPTVDQSSPQRRPLALFSLAAYGVLCAVAVIWLSDWGGSG